MLNKILPALTLCLVGCATNVTTKQELFTNGSSNDALQKNCYTYDTVGRNMARGMPTAVGVGIIGGLFPPLMLLGLVGIGAESAADQATLPVKCGLTLDDAIKEARTVSFYEDATALWTQKDGLASIVVKPIQKLDKCSIHQIIVTRKDNAQAQVRKFTQNVEICKNEEGLPVVTNENVALPTTQLTNQQALERWAH